MSRHQTLRFACRLLACLLSIASASCGDSGGGGPDTGSGAAQPVPVTRNCADFCGRAADCLVVLCDEDTMSKNYEPLGDIVRDQCLTTCTDALLASGVSASQWQCYFQSSCRQVFGADACHQNGTYSCK